MCLQLHTSGSALFSVTIVAEKRAIKFLDQALRHIMGHDGVWNASGAEIVAGYKGQG